MTDQRQTPQGGFAQDGYSRPQPLREGYIRKGGVNPSTSQIQTRPPAPPSSVRPATAPGQTASPSSDRNR